MMRSLTMSMVAVLLLTACGRGGQTAPLKELERVRSGSLNVVLLSAEDTLKPGKGRFAIEFRDAGGGLVDVGAVSVGASMTMPGMAPMFGETAVTPSATRGRYDVSSDLEMAGTWRLNIIWNGPHGRGEATMRATAS